MHSRGRMNKSKTDSVRTPGYITDYIRKHWGAYHDPVPFNEDFDPRKDACALATEWGDVNYVNPPYSHCRRFLEKACRLWLENGTVSVLLLKTDILGSQYVHSNLKHAELRFFKGRIHFTGYGRRAPFSSMLVIFDGKNIGKFSYCEININP